MELAILLATYNSEKYLREQIDSLFSQSYNNFTLYIRDDGSNDRTLNIIAEYKEKHTNIVILEDEVNHRGPMLGFMWLLQSVEADYYMFCDHDDVWLRDKIEVTLHKIMELESLNPNKAVVVNTDLIVVDKDLNVIAPSMWKYARIDRALLNTFSYLSVYNAFTGCTMILNDKARHISLPIGNHAYMHDWWIALKVAHQGGVLGYVNKATIMYRQHGHNTLGIKRVELKSFDRIKMIFNNLVSCDKPQINMIKEIGSFSLFKYYIYNTLYIFRCRFRSIFK